MQKLGVSIGRKGPWFCRLGKVGGVLEGVEKESMNCSVVAIEILSLPVADATSCLANGFSSHAVV